MDRNAGIEERILPRYSPSQGSATSAPAHPCTSSSGAPIPGLAWFPHGTGARGPQLCAHSPATLWGVLSTLNAQSPTKKREASCSIEFLIMGRREQPLGVHGRDRRVIGRGTSEESRAEETDPLRETVGTHTLL